MNPRLFLLVLILALGGMFAHAGTYVAAESGLAFTTQSTCEQALDNVLAEPDWADRLINPVLNSPEEVAQRAALYRPLYDCLATGGLPATQAYEDLYDLTGYFLLIAGSQVTTAPEQVAGRGLMTKFADIQDPAVVTMRDELGIPPPPGYLYVWLYPSVESMPPLLGNLFRTDEVRAVTLYTRYIIAIDDTGEQGGSDTGFTEYLRGLRSRTLSHELVHAYVNSHVTGTLGWERAASLPKWYAEGLAIYFSGSGEPSSYNVTTEDGGRVPVISYSPEDYVRYRDTFVYLEERYGREQFMAVVRDSINSADASVMYRQLGIQDEQSLMARVETDLRAGRIQRSLVRLGVILLALPVGLLLLWFLTRVISALLNPQPQYAGLNAAAAEPAPSPVPPRPVFRPIPQARVQHVNRPDVRDLIRRLQATGRSETMESEKARADAARQLGELHTSLAIAPLVEALYDRSMAVRSAAAWALGVLETPVPVTGSTHPVRSRWLTSAERARIMAELFHMVRNDPQTQVRQAAAASLYQTGGEPVLRPLVSIARGSNDSFQHWYAGWAAERGHYMMLIDLYPWAGENTRRRIRDLLQRHKTPPIIARLMRERDTGDQSLCRLAESVLGPPP